MTIASTVIDGRGVLPYTIHEGRRALLDHGALAVLDDDRDADDLEIVGGADAARLPDDPVVPGQIDSEHAQLVQGSASSDSMISKVWSFCHTLREGGAAYGDGLQQLT